MTFFLEIDLAAGYVKRPLLGEVVIYKSKNIMRPSARLPTCNVAPISPRVRHPLKDGLHLFPYKIQSQSELTPEQKARRLEFAQWFSEKLERDEPFEKNYMTDECYIHLSWLVNKQNLRYWWLIIQEMNL